LDNNQLEDDGVQALASGLAESQSLHALSLNGNGIRNSGACAIARAWVDHPLQYLSLNCNHIHNDGVLELARVLQADTMLRELDLYRNYAQTEAALKFVEVLMHSNVTLHKVELGCNCIANSLVVRQI
jgi:Ran GTPase-activating protein (RanGAP) involved in mRNA processing and transport